MACRGSSEPTHKKIKKLSKIEEIQKNIKAIRVNLEELGICDPKITNELTHLQEEINAKYMQKYGSECDPVELSIASWNLRNATLKGKHPQKIKVITDTIARLNPNIIALQEIAAPGDALMKICDSLPGKDAWDCAFAEVKERECSGFLWKRHSSVSVDMINSIDMGLSRLVVSLHMKLKKTDFTILNFHLAARTPACRIQECDQELLAMMNVHAKLETHCIPSNNLILIGDFNIHPYIEGLLSERHFETIIPPIQYTNIRQTRCYDNIIVHRVLKLWCYSWNVDVFSLRYPKIAELIPKMFDHCPILAKFKIPKLTKTYAYIAMSFSELL